MGLAAQMIAYLEDDGMVADFQDAFVPKDRSSALLVITPYGGLEPELVQDDPDKRTDIPRFQVLGVDKNGAAAEARAVEAVNRLARIQNRSIDGVWFQSVRPLRPVAFMRRDEHERTWYSGDCEARKAIDEVEGS